MFILKAQSELSHREFVRRFETKKELDEYVDTSDVIVIEVKEEK